VPHPSLVFYEMMGLFRAAKLPPDDGRSQRHE